MEKLTLFGSGNEGNRNFYILDKKEFFFSLFPLFLIRCGFKDIGIYKEYQTKKPKIDTFNNKIEHFKNKNYDIDLIYTNNRIILIIRTDVNNRDNLSEGIKKLVNF